MKNCELAQLVASKLRLEWSPEQVAGWLKRFNPDDEALQVSHETIYRSLLMQARGAPKKELMAHLRRTRGMRRSRHHRQWRKNKEQLSMADSPGSSGRLTMIESFRHKGLKRIYEKEPMLLRSTCWIITEERHI